jgi:hypothetical protein
MPVVEVMEDDVRWLMDSLRDRELPMTYDQHGPRLKLPNPIFNRQQDYSRHIIQIN